MSSPCPKCGEARSDPVRRGTLYTLASVFGYRLQRCLRCRALRLLPRHHRKSPDASQWRKEQATAHGLAGVTGTLETAEQRPAANEGRLSTADSSNRGSQGCPACGSTEYHRTHRTSLERLQSRPRMARCEKCGVRFPHPGHHRKYPDPVKLAVAAEAVARFEEEKKGPTMAEENPQAKVTEQVAAADSSNRGSRGCPACGSTEYHRTRRTLLERLRFRPAMARCEKCGGRFPYPGRRGKHPDPLKLAGATEPRPEEEKTAPTVDAESSRPKLSQQVTVVAFPNPGTAADSSSQGLRRCPFCGSTSYRRSRRTTLEHLLLRPKMARCRHCRKRFPYPRE
jgi:predicted  nucleic acid-binding Zn-ribbon protein